MKLDALLRNLRHHAGHTTRRGSKTHLRALFVNSGLPLPRVLSALAHPGKRPGRRGPMPGTLPKRPRKDPDEEEPTVEYTPRLSSARRRAKRCGKVSELPAVGAAGEDAALLYDVVATAELDAARTPPSTDAEECDDADALALMALSRS